MGGHKTLRFPLLLRVGLAYFYVPDDVEWRSETTPGDPLPRPFLMGCNSKRSIFKRTCASLTAFLFMKRAAPGRSSVVITEVGKVRKTFHN